MNNPLRGTPHPDRPAHRTIGPASLHGVLVADGDAWLTQRQIGELFGVGVSTISRHVAGIQEDGELAPPDAGGLERRLARGVAHYVIAVPSDRGRTQTQLVCHYSSRMVQHIGYRVRSERGVQYRQWVSSVIRGEVETPAPPSRSSPGFGPS